MQLGMNRASDGMGGNMVRRLMKGWTRGRGLLGNREDPRGFGCGDAARSRPGGRSRTCGTAQAAAGRLADGAGGGGRRDPRDLAGSSQKDDILVDGGNSYYVDDIRRAKALAPHRHPLRRLRHERRVWGLAARYCLMIGGDPRGREAPRPDLRLALPPARRGAAPAGAREESASTRRERLPSRLRPGKRRRRHFSAQDELHQRHRVRDSCGLRRGDHILKHRQTCRARGEITPSTARARPRCATPEEYQYEFDLRDHTTENVCGAGQRE